VEYYLEEAHAPGTGAPEGDDAEKDAGAAKDIFSAVSIETKDEYPTFPRQAPVRYRSSRKRKRGGVDILASRTRRMSDRGWQQCSDV
jgi:hypothetical protein